MLFIHSKNEYPDRVPNEEFSVDVITCDEDGLLCIGYYNFDTGRWGFHSDTMVDYYEEGIPEMEFVWMYPPKELTDFNPSSGRAEWRGNRNLK